MIKVLIVEDSPVIQEILVFTISSDPEFKIVGVASNGEDAIEFALKEKPDVITMDLHMPKLNGLEATREIMETNPTPIVVVTGSAALNDIAVSFSLMEAGALAIVRKTHSITHPDYKQEARELITTIKLMSEVKLVRRKPKLSNITQPNSGNSSKIQIGSQFKMLVMGASTGGPLVLQKIISKLPKNYPLPILIVQHISPGFIGGFIEWLTNTTNQAIHLAVNGEKPLPGHIYFAPDGFHMGVESGPRIFLSPHPPENGLRPSVAYLFRTAADSFKNEAIGVLLTGMGRDGAAELKLLKEQGAVTIAQDKESSVVHGMPGDAIKLNAASYVLSPDEIANMLISLVKI